MELTEDMIQQGAYNGCGFNRPQLEALGVPWHKGGPTKGWRRRLIGTDITPEAYARFLRLKGATRKSPKQPRDATYLNDVLDLPEP